MIEKIIILIIFLLTMTSCANVKETLTLQKKRGVDEFLIEKKIH